jgi:hypothetical protein
LLQIHCFILFQDDLKIYLFYCHQRTLCLEYCKRQPSQVFAVGSIRPPYTVWVVVSSLGWRFCPCHVPSPVVQSVKCCWGHRHSHRFGGVCLLEVSHIGGQVPVSGLSTGLDLSMSTAAARRRPYMLFSDVVEEKERKTTSSCVVHVCGCVCCAFAIRFEIALHCACLWSQVNFLLECLTNGRLPDRRLNFGPRGKTVVDNVAVICKRWWWFWEGEKANLIRIVGFPPSLFPFPSLILILTIIICSLLDTDFGPVWCNFAMEVYTNANGIPTRIMFTPTGLILHS